MNDLLSVFLAGVVTMLATGLGVIPVVVLGRRAESWRPLLCGLAVGAMAVASVVGLIQPGLDQGSPAEVYGGLVLGGLLFFAIRAGLRHREVSVGDIRGADVRRAALVFAVLFAHSLPEGFAIGTAYASPEVNIGLFVILAIALQNVPEGTSVAIPLQDAGVGFWRQFWLATATSIPQPIGAVFAFLLVDQISGLLPISFGFAAGAMLVLVVIEMIPQAFVRGAYARAVVGTALGAAMIFGLEQVVAI